MMQQRLSSRERAGARWRQRMSGCFAWAKRDHGQSLVEFSMLLPVLAMLLLGVIDFGRAFYLSIEVNNAAYAAALYGSQNAGDITGMEAAATADAPNVPGGITFPTPPVSGCECADGTNVNPVCPATPPTCSGSNLVSYVQVTTMYNYKPMFPWPGIPSPIPLHGSAWIRASQ